MNKESTEEIDESWSCDDVASAFFRAFQGWSDKSLPVALHNSIDFEKYGPEHIHIDNLYVPIEFRGRGFGKQIMKKIVDLADLHKAVLTLNPAWIGEGDAQIDLTQWYASFGFSTAAMIRHPQGAVE